jgi:hypothetical protein
VNVFFWILQIILGIKFLSVAFTHGFPMSQAKMLEGMERASAGTRRLMPLVAIGVLLGSVALILPPLLGVLPWLAPAAAALLALMMLLAVRLHISCREAPKVVVSLILFALAAFTAYGRWVIAPF